MMMRLDQIKVYKRCVNEKEASLKGDSLQG